MRSDIVFYSGSASNLPLLMRSFEPSNGFLRGFDRNRCFTNPRFRTCFHNRQLAHDVFVRKAKEASRLVTLDVNATIKYLSVARATSDPSLQFSHNASVLCDVLEPHKEGIIGQSLARQLDLRGIASLTPLPSCRIKAISKSYLTKFGSIAASTISAAEENPRSFRYFVTSAA